MLCRPARSSDWLVSVITNSEFDFNRFIQNGVGDRGVIEQGFALGVASGRQTQIVLFVLHKDVAALGAGEFQGGVEQGHQDFVEHAGGVQLARRFEEKRQLLQIGGVVRDLDAGNLAEEFAGRVGAGMVGMENDVSNVAHAKLDAVVPLQGLALDSFAVDESSVLAALVHHAELPVFRGDQSMVAGDARIGDDQVLIDLATDRERGMVEVDGALIVALHENKGRKNSRPRGRNWACDGWIGHLAGLLLNYYCGRIGSSRQGVRLCLPASNWRREA